MKGTLPIARVATAVPASARPPSIAPEPVPGSRNVRDDGRASDLRERFVAEFGEHLALAIEAAIERHVPRLRMRLERGSDPFRFALVWAVGLECLTRDEFRAQHGIEVPWELLREWLREADLLAGFDGTFDWGGRAAGRFDEIVGPGSDEDYAEGVVARDEVVEV